MVRGIVIVLVLAVALIGFGGQASASSGEASDRACVGQFTAETARLEDSHPVGQFVRDAAQSPVSNYGDLQSDVAVAESCDEVKRLFAKRYSI